MTMPEAVQAIVELALIEGRSEADVYAEKRVEWRAAHGGGMAHPARLLLRLDHSSDHT